MCYMKNNLENAFGVKANDFHKALLGKSRYSR